MKHVVRLVPVLVIVVLVLSMPMVAFAQDPLCEGLSEADCDMMLSALDTVATVESFTVPAWEFTLKFDSGEEVTELSAAGSAGFVIADDIANSVVYIKLDSLVMVPDDPSLPETAELLVVDGFGYVNYDGEWYGEELSESDLADVDEMLGMVESSGSITGMDESLGLDLTGVVTTTREADDEMHGQSVAVYSMEVDLMTLLVNALSSPMVGEALGMGDMGMEEMSPEELSMMAMMFAPILGESGIGAGLVVGEDDGYIHGVELWVDLDIDLSMMGADSPPITGEIYFSAEVTDVDAGFSVDPPASYGSMDELEDKLDEIEVNPLEGLGGLGL